MEQYIRITEPARNVRRMALAELRGHWKTACLAFVLYYMLLVLPVLLFDFMFGKTGIAIPASLIGADGNGESIFNSFLNTDSSGFLGLQVRGTIEVIYLFIINAPLFLGFSGFLLSVSRGANPGLGMILDGFNNFFRAVGTYLMIMLRVILLYLLCIAVYVLLFTTMLVAVLAMYGLMGLVVFWLLLVASSLAIMAAVFRISLTYSQAFFLLVDDPHCGVKNAIRQSRNMMFGNKKKLLFLYLSFIGWGVALFIIFCVIVNFLLPWLIDAPYGVELLVFHVLFSVLPAPLYAYAGVSGAVFYDILTGRRGSWPAGGESFRNFDAESSRIASGDDREPYGNYDEDREPYGNTDEDREPYGKDDEDM
jgi:uncharacterized membrane protein